MNEIAGIGGSVSVSGTLALVICLVCHQVLLFCIGRWTIDLDGWRAVLTSMAGVAGLSIGSVSLPVFAAPLFSMAAAFITMKYVYEMALWQRLAMTAGWYLFPLASLFAAGALFATPDVEPRVLTPEEKEQVIEQLKKAPYKQEAESMPEESE